MKTAAISVLLRYLAIAIQFAVVVFVTRNLPLDVAGQYFTVFGIIAVAFTLSAFGIPDGCVKILGEARAQENVIRQRKIVIATMPTALLMNFAIAPLIGAVGIFAARLSVQDLPIIAIWWFGYAGTFLCAQFLVGAGKPVLATFFAYSSINLMYLITLLPALILADDLDLRKVMSVAAGASNLALVFAGIACLRAGRGLFIGAPAAPDGTGRPSISEVAISMRAGIPMMMSRFMQASLPWIPVWLLTYYNSPETSAIYAAASRLTVAVTSVVAALRFSMRGTIIAANVAGDFASIATLNRTVSLVSSVPPILGLVFLAFFGSWAVPAVLGADYALAVPVLMVLMFAVLGEAFGGLSDEILKMTGRTRIVVWSLFGAMICQVVFGVVFAGQGPLYVAVGTVLAFTLQYVWQVIWLSCNTPIAILSFISKNKE